MVPTGELPRHILLSVDRSLTNLVVPGTRVTVLAIYATFANRGNVCKNTLYYSLLLTFTHFYSLSLTFTHFHSLSTHFHSLFTHFYSFFTHFSLTFTLTHVLTHTHSLSFYVFFFLVCLSPWRLSVLLLGTYFVSADRVPRQRSRWQRERPTCAWWVLRWTRRAKGAQALHLHRPKRRSFASPTKSNRNWACTSASRAALRRPSLAATTSSAPSPVCCLVAPASVFLTACASVVTSMCYFWATRVLPSHRYRENDSLNCTVLIALSSCFSYLHRFSSLPKRSRQLVCTRRARAAVRRV